MHRYATVYIAHRFWPAASIAPGTDVMADHVIFWTQIYNEKQVHSNERVVSI